MATEQQIPKLAGAIVEHQSDFAALSTEDAQWVITETKSAIALFVEAVKNRAKTAATKLLEFVTTVTVPAVSKFVAADHFKRGETVDGVKCYLWDNFREHFLGKIEKNVAGCDIRVHKLLRSSRDLGIRSEIGEDKEETKLANLWSLLKLQGKGEKGALLTNGYANIFYVRDTEDMLWAVGARWRAGYRGWYLYANSVEYPREWFAGFRVCSR
jgi:hypothetical protein